MADNDGGEDTDGKIYCANCIHCVLVKNYTGVDGQYVLRVKCLTKCWKKKLGEEKVYKFFTVARRTVDSCESYEPMGELKTYLKDLRKSLPIKDEVYTV
ncbi:MAG: hypothetical protein OEZ36_04395 [Spirochaetota bacterium]|nr:hypothetical protein [Spirochaetota bacterium]